MSFLPPQTRKVAIAVFVILLVFLAALRSLRGMIGPWGYIIGLPLGVLIICVVYAREIWKNTAGMAVASEISICVGAGYQLACESIPRAVTKNHWKLTQANIDEGHFEARIGVSLWTYGQIMHIDVSRSNDSSTEIKIRCEAPHQVWDHGQNDRMIAKFRQSLEEYLSV